MAPSPRRSVRHAVALAGLVSMLACASAPLDPSQDEAFEAILVQVEQAVGARAERPVDARIVSRDGIREVIAEAVASQRSQEEMAAYEAGLVTVGLWPRGRPLAAEFVSVMSEEVVGLYLPFESALFVVGDDEDASFGAWLETALAADEAQASFVLSHELVHLLQHQEHPELFEGEVLLGHDDAALAVQAAFEGDALRTGLLALGVELPESDAFEDVLAGVSDESGGALAAAPALIRGLIGFPYARGYGLALADGAAVLSEPPASTEQVLHPELRRADFQVFDLRAARSAVLGGAGACEPEAENTVGELQLSILFDDLAGELVPESAWQGWDGDRYLAARCAEGPALLWLTAWDSEEDAASFAAAYAAVAGAVAERAGIAGPLAVELRGREVTIVSSALADRLDGISERVRRERVATLAELRTAVGSL